MRMATCMAFVFFVVSTTLTLPARAGVAAAVPEAISTALSAGATPEAILLVDDVAVEAEAAGLRARAGRRLDTPDILAVKQARYRDLRQKVLAALPAGAADVLIEYSHLPLAVVRLRSRQAIDALAAHPSLRAIYENERKYPVLDSQSASLVKAPQAIAGGFTGAGTSVVVVDTGADYTVADLGACSAPGAPATCHILLAYAVTTSGVVTADSVSPNSPSNAHGTNVAAIVAGVAPGTRLVVMNVFGSGGSTSDAQILAAINWAVANAAAHNIKAINLSLGDNMRHTAPCSAGNPFVTPVALARSAGIVTAAASGNNGYSDGINSPGCTPAAVSVGAVYSGDFGGLNWGICTDYSTAADQVACFSNSASFMTLLAPGAIVTAGGQQFGGTSQATPFIAGSVAVLGAAFAEDTPDQTVARMTGTGTGATDARNGIVKPRLDLYAATAVGAAQPDQDVPTLPEWAAMCLLGMLLLAAMRRHGLRS